MKYKLKNGNEVYAECEGCHKEKEIVHIGGHMPFCEECCKGIPKELWYSPLKYINQ